MSKINKLKLYFICLLLVPLIACVHTPVSFPEPSPELQKLASLQLKPIELQIDVPNHLPAGNQYLFFVIPFGQIHLESFYQDVLISSSEKLLLSGYKPIAKTNNYYKHPKIIIKYKNAQVSAFDLFATRKIKVLIELYYERFNQDGLLVSTGTLKGQASGYKSQAFSKQLNFYYQKALRAAFENLI